MKLMTQANINELPTSEEGYQPLSSVALSEPRLTMIERRLKALMSIVQLESNGKPVEIDGFRLRDPGQWTGPAAPISSEMWNISSACNMRCPFCYEEGDPTCSSVLNEPAGMSSMKEIETRLRSRRNNKGAAMFQPLTYINEIFCNPNALRILERIREEAPREVLTFVTNGTYLTEEMVARLAAIKPMFFNYSVNSLDPTVRERVLRDRQPAVAIEALDHLRRMEIPYLGSLVCWPTIPWSDIEATVRKLDAAGCAVIRFSLSAYSKHLKGRRFSRQEFWSEGATLAQRLQQEIATPIKIEPYHFVDPTNEANLVGTIVGSPAACAGIKPGDCIVAVDGHAIPSVNHALTAIQRAARTRQEISLLLRRPGKGDYSVLLDDRKAAGFPYASMRTFPGFEFGLILVENLQYGHLKAVADAISTHAAKRVLLLSSELMRPVIEKMIAQTRPFGDTEVFVEVPDNRYFGGTIVLGDLLVVSDYVDFIQQFCEAQPVDLVIIPSSPFSLSGWMRDLAGRPSIDIERLTGIRVEIIDCTPLNG